MLLVQAKNQAELADFRVELARHLGRRLRYLRAQVGITQEELALRARIDRARLSKMETGKSLPDLATLARLAGGLEVGLAEILRAMPDPARDSAFDMDVSETPHPPSGTA
jgi:transcriptional regulator with XRE-family HTH domain